MKGGFYHDGRFATLMDVVNHYKFPLSMEEKFNEATTQRPQGDRPLDAPLVTIDLHSFIKQIRNDLPVNAYNYIGGEIMQVIKEKLIWNNIL